MKKIFLLANLCLAFGLTAPRSLFAESGLIFDQAQGTLYGQLNVPTTAAAGLTVSSSAYLAVSGGKVGIGTAGPEAPLHIRHLAAALNSYDDVLKINSFITGGAAGGADPGFGPAILFYGSIYGLGERDLGRIAMVSEGGNVAGMSFYTQTTADSVTEKVRITSQGNVGIGTTGPGYKLDVNGTLGVAGNALFVSATGDNFRFHANGDTFGGNASDVIFSGDGVAGQGYYFWKAVADYNGTPVTAATLHSSGALGLLGNLTVSGTGDTTIAGKVGVGTLSPGTNLEVRKDQNAYTGIRVSNTDMTATGYGTQAGYWIYGTAGYVSIGALKWVPNLLGASAGALYLTTEANYPLAFGLAASPTPSMIIATSGNVGIGTTVPGEKLDVAGIIRSTTGGFKFPDNTTQTTAAPGDWIRLTANLTTYGNSANQCQSEFGVKWNVCGYPEVAGFVKDITQQGLSGVIAWIACGRSSMLQSGAIKRIGISGDAADSGVWTCPADKGCNWEQFAGSGGYLHCYRTESTQQKVYCCRNQL